MSNDWSDAPEHEGPQTTGAEPPASASVPPPGGKPKMPDVFASGGGADQGAGEDQFFQQGVYHDDGSIYEDDTGSGFPSWIFGVGVLILINVLSFVFDWGFIIW